MTRQYQRNPASELNNPRSDLIVSVAMFYKRPFTFEDLQVINPKWCERKKQVQIVLNRLIQNGYLIKSGKTYQITEYAYRQNVAYLAWKKIFKKDWREAND